MWFYNGMLKESFKENGKEKETFNYISHNRQHTSK